jgi:simple sugar transport system ATP-binding protein
VPEDRLSLGLVMNQSVRHNVVLTIIEKLLNALKLIDKGKTTASVVRWVDDLHIRVADPQDSVNTLSGGNQQRVVLAKWIATQPMGHFMLNL